MSNIRFNYEKEQKRVAAYDGSKCVGSCNYVNPGSFWIITHTDVDPAYGGQGIARSLVDILMHQAVEAGVKVKPFCSYAAGLFQKNSAYAEQEDLSMITVFEMPTCPDCAYVEEQMKDNKSFRRIDIGEHIKYMKAFTRIRDNSPVFDDAKRRNSVLRTGGWNRYPVSGRCRPEVETGGRFSLQSRWKRMLIISHGNYLYLHCKRVI